MKRLAAVTFACVMTSVAQADQSSAFQDANAFATGKTQGVFTGVRSGTVEDKIPGYGTNPSETQFFQGGQGALSWPGVTKMQSCASYTPGQDKVANQECEAVNFLAKNPDVRPQFAIGNNDQMILGAKNARDNAATVFQSLGINGGTGSGAQCTSRTETTPAQYSTETCTALMSIEGQQCVMGRSININTDANIQCDQTVNAYETLTCQRSSTASCTGGGDGCDAGGIVPNSWAGDMSVTWLPAGGGIYNLTFGTIADNYWGGWGAVYDRTLTFSVSDRTLITRFALTRAAFDDWLWVKVNDNTVYVGPYGGDRLYTAGTLPPVIVFEPSSSRTCFSSYDYELGPVWRCYTTSGWYIGDPIVVYTSCSVVSGGWNCTPQANYGAWPWMVNYCADCWSGPELSTSWNFGLNIDIKPYLKEGTNTVWMRTIVAGGGEGAIVFATRQVCPLNCSISTQSNCAALESRAK